MHLRLIGTVLQAKMASRAGFGTRSEVSRPLRQHNQHTRLQSSEKRLRSDRNSTRGRCWRHLTSQKKFFNIHASVSKSLPVC